MDPLAAIGLVANIISFIDLGTKVINNARAIYNSASNSTEDTQTQELLANKMGGFSQKLLPPITTNLSQDERDLHDLATECKNLAGDIIFILNKNRPKRQTWYRATKSAVKNMKHEPEMDGLQHRLDNCRNQLNFQLNYVMNSEHREKLDNLIKDARRNSSQIAELHAQVNQIHQRVNLASLAPESQEQFKKLLSIPEEAFDIIVSDRFLESLKVSGMFDRFDAVQAAHYETFKWIFKGTEETDLMPDKHASQLKEPFLSDEHSDHRSTKMQQSFLSWLSSGDGIFHISGKLGSGKSTLMRFLYKHDCTRKLLQQWAGDRVLVLASFFFWKPGSKLQKSFDALVRSLLYGSLQSAPGLIPLVFPHLWMEAKSVPWQAQTSINLSLDEINQGFDRLVYDKEISKRHCFCFFIDGLDEWEELDKINFDSTDMVHELTRWTECDARNIKICASSREYNAFMNGFSPEKRIRLQDLTRQDMVAFINNRLDFPSSSHELSPHEKRKLVYSIITKANGIFLWVALVMRRLREMAENWASFSQLETEIGSLPEGLENLFDHIFRSLKSSDRKIAYQTFAILLRWGELERQWDGGDRLRVRSSSSQPWDNRSQLSIPLSAYYFIDKQPLDLGYHDTFSITKSCEQFSESDMLEQTRRLLMGICKGLVEVKYDTWEGPVLSFTHRSVPEFLRFRRDKMIEILRDFNPDKAICQLLLAYVENGLPRSKADHTKLSLFTRRVLGIRHHFQIPAASFKFEERWDAALIELGVTIPSPDYKTFAIPQSMATGTSVARNPNGKGSYYIASPLYIAAYFAYSAYVNWKIRSDPIVNQSHFQKALLFWCVLHSEENIHEALSIVDVLLEHDLHSPVLGDLGDCEIYATNGSSMTNWHHFMLAFIADQWNTRRSSLLRAVMQKFLEVGADPCVSLKVKAEESKWVYELYVGLERHHCATVTGLKTFKVNLLLDLPGIRHNHTMSFREIIEAFSHEKKQEILLLIDRNMRRLGLGEKAEQPSRRLLGVLYKYFQRNWAVIWIIGVVFAFMVLHILFT